MASKKRRLSPAADPTAAADEDRAPLAASTTASAAVFYQQIDAADAGVEFTSPPTAAAPSPPEDDKNDTEISNILETFTKSQLITLLRSAAALNPQTRDEIHRVADDSKAAHRNLFVHGIAFATTTATLHDAFAVHGEIEDCRIVTDRQTGKSKGFGFVLFKNREAANRALAEPKKIIDNRMTTCQLAALGLNSNASGNVTVTPSSMPGVDRVGRKIYVERVDAEVDTGRLREFFAQFGEIEEGPVGFDRRTGKFKGYAFFVYRTAEDARKAIEEPRKMFEGRQLFCKMADSRPKAALAHENANAPSDNVNWSGGVGEGYTYVDAPPGFGGYTYVEAPPGFIEYGYGGATQNGVEYVAPPPGFGGEAYGGPTPVFIADAYGIPPPGFVGEAYGGLPPGFVGDAYGIPPPSLNGKENAGYVNAGFQGPPGFSEGQQLNPNKGGGGGSYAYQSAQMGQGQMVNLPGVPMGGYGAQDGSRMQHQPHSSADPSHVFYGRTQ